MARMKVAPNQKVVTVHKVCDNRSYARFDQDALRNAIQRMSGKRASGFIVWTILASNRTGFQLPISSSMFQREYGITKDQYDAGIRILIESGFLIKGHGNKYDFFEYPESHKSGEMPLLKVGKSHSQKWENPTFKSGKTPQDNNIILDTIVLDNTLSSSTEKDDDDEQSIILSEAAKAGFPQNDATRQLLLRLLSTYGRDFMLSGIQKCVSQASSRPAYLEACLQNMAAPPATGWFIDDQHERW